MIVVEKKTGSGTSMGLIRYVNPWSKELEQNDGIYFYALDVRLVIDVLWDEEAGVLRVYSYPHNDANIVSIATSLESNIATVVGSLRKQNPHRKIFTLTLEQPAVREITPGDFTRYYPSPTPKDELFIFGSGMTGLGFMEMYLFEQMYMRNNPEFLYVAASCSHDIMKCAGEPTEVGKEFVYVLLQSKKNRKFIASTPYTKSMRFPTNGRSELPAKLNVTLLDKFAETLGSELQNKGGVEVINATLVPNLNDDENNEGVVFGKLSRKDLLAQVQEQISQKGSANLSDVFQIGLGKVLESIPLAGIMIDVIPDIAAVGKKMCILSGKFYIVPYDDSFEVVEFFGEPEELFVVCDEDSYPKRPTIIPQLPPTVTNLLQ